MNGQTQNDPTSEEEPDETMLPTPVERAVETPPTQKFKLTSKFALGFLGWYFITTLFYWLPRDRFTLGMFLFPVNLVILIVLLRKQTQVGWGMLSAIAVNLVISLILGLGFNALCFLPFFIPLH